MVKKTNFVSGLRLVTKNLPNTQSVTVLILVGAGSRYETKEINGISHFLEHMFFKGAKRYRNARDVAGAIDAVGGDFNAFTGKEYAGYYVKVAADKIDTALDVLSDMLINVNLATAEIEKERGVILEEYNMYQDTPMYQIGWNFEKLLFGDQPLGWNQVGTKELIAAVSARQFRTYLRDLYTADNTVIAVAGNFDRDALVKKVEKKFVFPAARLKRSHGFTPFEPDHSATSATRVHLRDKKTEQAHVVVGFPSCSAGSPDYFAARLLAVIMGGNMSSRMFLSVREQQGLAYYIHTATDEYQDIGTISTNAGVSVGKIDQALRSIMEEYRLAAKKGFSVVELKKAQAFLAGKIVLRLEDSEEYAHLIGKYELLLDRSVALEDLRNGIEAVKLSQLNRLASQLFRPELMRLAVIGPYDDGARFEKLIKNY